MSTTDTALVERVPAESSPAQLAKVFGRVSRALRYRTRAANEALGVTDSETELLRLVRRRPGVRVQEAAVSLGIASNSVSTLVKQLTRGGLIERTADPLDGRGVCLQLTPEAASWLAEVATAREAAFARAYDSLSDDDRAAIERALPPLTRLADAVRTTPSSAQ